MLKKLFKRLKITPEIRLTGLETLVQELCIDIKKLKAENRDLIKIIELEKETDKSVFKKYQYKQWCEITPVLQNYLTKRFHINVIKYGGIGIPVGTYANHNDFFGQTIEKYYVFNEDGKSVNKYEEK